MIFLKKIFGIFCVYLSLCMVFSNIVVYAQDSHSISNMNDTKNTCSLAREEKTVKDEEFISFIEKEYNISRNDENVFVQYNGNGTTSISILEPEGEVTVFTSPTKEEIEEFGKYNENSKGILWTAVVWLMRDYKGIKYGCEKIRGVSGVDVCESISKQVIDSFVASGTKKKFKVIRSIVKEPCPYPPHSQQCNQPPFVYWKTTVQAY